MSRNSSQWSTQSVAPISWHATRVALTLDTNNHPHLAFTDYVPFYTMLKYAHYDGTQWQIHQADAGRAIGNDLTIALNSHNTPYILHQDYHNGHIKLSQLATSTTYSPLILNP